MARAYFSTELMRSHVTCVFSQFKQVDRPMSRLPQYVLAAALLSLSTAAAYDDPVGNEIQSRMQDEAQRQINDIGAAPPWPDEDYYEDEGDYAYDDAPAYSQEEWVTWTAELARQDAERQAAQLNDPRYQAFLNGEWLYTSPPAGQADRPCSALFLRQGVGVMVVALGGKADTALLIFFGTGIPAPAKIERTKVVLTQTGDAPAEVEVFNAALAWAPGLGSIVFAVPSAEAALGGMIDTLAFDIAQDGKSLATIEWNGGLAARDKLNACIADRT